MVAAPLKCIACVGSSCCLLRTGRREEQWKQRVRQKHTVKGFEESRVMMGSSGWEKCIGVKA